MRATSSCGNVSRFWEDSRSFVYILGLACSFISSSRRLLSPVLGRQRDTGFGVFDSPSIESRLLLCGESAAGRSVRSRLPLLDADLTNLSTMNSSSSGCPSGQWFGSVVWRMNLFGWWMIVCLRKLRFRKLLAYSSILLTATKVAIFKE